ncbi:hypothetical protein HLB44_05935 [Aquincola sp. S2]|uniref:DUF4185 domain-containing protein n=1 Tax=Pseudaquabacterium terrae TaxID=2732868 RepID=A0ABX2EBK5_9BURK|nr:hypothetical protein [Aquabacterium terrae]
MPAPGRWAVIDAVNGWNDIDPCPSNTCGYRIGSGPEWNKVIDDFSGGVYNPHWGPLGALILHGGGHSATNDNSVALLDFNDLRFKRIADPSLEATGLRPADGPIFPGYDREHGEYVADRKPGSAHTYDALEVIPPEVAGAPYGGLVRPFSSAVHASLSALTNWAHLLAMHEREVATAAGRARNSWSRWSVNAGQTFGGAGGSCAYDTRRKRIWWSGVPSSRPGRINYLDCVTREQVTVRYGGTDAMFDVSMPIMRYLPGPDLLLWIGPRPGRAAVEAYFMRAGDPASGWRPVTLGLAIPVALSATPWDFVPALNRIVLFTRADTSAVYEIDVPSDPASTWPTQRRTFDPVPALSAPDSIVGKRFSYSPALRCIVYKPRSATPSLSQFLVYRPLGT